jgi:hypothetical protein
MKRTAPKLGIRRETLIQLNDLRQAQGGGSRLYNTVYYPAPSDLCSRGCPIQA